MIGQLKEKGDKKKLNLNFKFQFTFCYLPFELVYLKLNC